MAQRTAIMWFGHTCLFPIHQITSVFFFFFLRTTKRGAGYAQANPVACSLRDKVNGHETLLELVLVGNTL